MRSFQSATSKCKRTHARPTTWIIIPIFFFSINTVFTQVKYEKGYIIDNDNRRVECLIKNLDWKNNPSQIEIKRTVDAKVQLKKINDLKEFGIINFSKYERHKVDLEISRKRMSELSPRPDPVYETRTLWLKVLIEGKATLFLYESQHLEKYLFEIADSGINTLVYKQYRASSSEIGNNNRYHQQLWSYMKIAGKPPRYIKSLKYNRKSLKDYFIAYNSSQNHPYINHDDGTKQRLNFSLRPGIGSARINLVEFPITGVAYSFGSAISYRLGFETELVLAFNKNRWSLIVEPTLQRTEATSEFIRLGLTQKATFNYNSIEMPIGFRRYIVFSDRSKLYINAALVMEIGAGFNLEFENDIKRKLRTLRSLSYGIGYKSDKVSLELRNTTPKQVIGNVLTDQSQIRTLSLILGYTL